MKSKMERKFKITKIEAIRDTIMVTLTVMKPKTPDVRKVIEPAGFKTEEERIGYRMGLAVLEGMVGLASPISPSRPMTPVGIPIALTKDEYAEIGSPSVNQILVFDMRMKVT